MKNSGVTRKVFRMIIAALVGLLILVLCGLYYPPILVIGYALIGRSPVCSIFQAFRSAQTSFRHHQLESAYLSSGNLFRLSESDSMGFSQWGTPEGNYWIPEGNDKVLRVLTAQQRSDIYGIGRNGVQPGDIVLDCGAHVGIFTRKALNLGASKVIAIEPGKENLECLRRNLKNEISQGLVIVYPEGVWDQEGILEFHTFDRNSAADSFITQDSAVAGRTYKVKVTTVDKLASSLGLARIDFIKMDIKGSTKRALQGAKETLARYKPRMAISTEETADNPQSIITLCRKLQPAYETDCGYCAIENGIVLPMVVFFR